MEICFVILHYLAYDMTKECVDMLLDVFSERKIHIAIVDNGSPNRTGIKLKEQYADNSSITVLLNKENLGYARGNNVGYRYISERFKPRYIVVMNNDVLIKDRLFIEKIRDLEDTYGFDVLGPDIHNPYNNIHQNPLRITPITVDEVKKRLKESSFIVKYPHICYALSILKHSSKGKEPAGRTVEIYGKPRCDVVLHGACLIFSKHFMEKRKECFNPKTFIYGEEHILYHECMKQNLKMVYSPEIYVEHYMRVSTDVSFKSNYKKYISRYRRLKESAVVMLNVLEMRG